MKWLDGLAVGERVLAHSSAGFWVRAEVLSLEDERARVRAVNRDEGEWLPPLYGFASTYEWVTPERLADLPDSAPSVLPEDGAPVVVLWNAKVLHHATLVKRLSDAEGIVRYPEGDEEPVRAPDVLRRGRPDPARADALRARGFVERASVLAGSDGAVSLGWIDIVGSGVAYVRFEDATNGSWYGPEALKLVGSAGPERPLPTASKGEPLPGARVIALWHDRTPHPGTVRASREGELEVLFDDGDVLWMPAHRAVVTAPPGPSVPQADEREPVHTDTWKPRDPVLVMLPDGEWARGRVVTLRGADVLVEPRGNAKERRWARGALLAAPPTPDRFPAPETSVIVALKETSRSGKRRTVYHAGRVSEAVGGLVQVRLRDLGTRTVEADAIWRCAHPVPKRPLPEGLKIGDEVLVERELDDFVRARVTALRPPHGFVRVAYEDRGANTVDPARVHPAPKIEPAPEPAPPPPEPEPPSDDERARRLMHLVALEWNRAGYRAGGAMGGRVALEVEPGELTLRVRIDGERFAIELTAAGAVVEAPPIDGVTVRLARWVRGLFDDPVDEAAHRAAADRAWAAALCPSGRCDVVRAGDALALTVHPSRPPDVGDVITWARAAHSRLFEPATSGGA